MNENQANSSKAFMKNFATAGSPVCNLGYEITQEELSIIELDDDPIQCHELPNNYWLVSALPVNNYDSNTLNSGKNLVKPLVMDPNILMLHNTTPISNSISTKSLSLEEKSYFSSASINFNKNYIVVNETDVNKYYENCIICKTENEGVLYIKEKKNTDEQENKKILYLIEDKQQVQAKAEIMQQQQEPLQHEFNIFNADTLLNERISNFKIINSIPNSQNHDIKTEIDNSKTYINTTSITSPIQRKKKVDTKEFKTNAYARPPYSYSCLILLAFKNSQTGILSSAEINSFISDNFPYFKTANKSWKYSVRYRLNHREYFEKFYEPTDKNKRLKPCLWVSNPSKITKLIEDIKQCSRNNSLDIKKSMMFPDDFERLQRGEMEYSSNPGSYCVKYIKHNVIYDELSSNNVVSSSLIDNYDKIYQNDIKPIKHKYNEIDDKDTSINIKTDIAKRNLFEYETDPSTKRQKVLDVESSSFTISSPQKIYVI